MKNINQKNIVCAILILLSSICLGQKDTTYINDIKANKISDKNGLIWHDYQGIVRANFNENYRSLNYNLPLEVATEYLKLNHNKIGLDENLTGLKLIRSLKLGNRENLYFEQFYNNVPIFGTEIIITLNKENEITYVLNNCKNTNNIQNVFNDDRIGKQGALNIALNNLENIKIDSDFKISNVYVEVENEELLLCWEVKFDSWLFLISAIDGKIIKKSNSVLEADIQSKVHAVNPLYTANAPYGTSGFIDNTDQPSSQLNGELTNVTLDNVSYCWALGKQGYSNEYCYVINIESPNIEYDQFYNNYSLSSSDYWYTFMDRGDDMFEVAMVLFHIDKAGKWVESLGYSPEKVYIDAHGSNYDGAWTDLMYSGTNRIRFGIGGVDNAEDQTVIWHEYAHHINYILHPNKTSFWNHVGDLPTASVMEGFADYFASSYKNTISGWDEYTVGEWGMAEYLILYPEKRRRTDTDLVYPDDYTQTSSHYNGQIFSSALMKVRNEIGRNKTDKILLESINDWGISPSLESAGENFINTSENLYGKEYLCECVSNLKLHGLTQRPFSQKYKNVTDEVIQSSKTFNDACYFTFENVIVNNSPNINVIVEPLSGETTILSSFEVKLGSTFEIK